MRQKCSLFFWIKVFCMTSLLMLRKKLGIRKKRFSSKSPRVALTGSTRLSSEDFLPDSDGNKRRDFRGITTFTIDPADAKDFDDALSIKLLPNNQFEVGIHIADVSHYLNPGSILDQEASKRATSIYLVDRTIPMLPEALSNNICSLMPKVDRLAFSAVFTIDQTGDISDRWFGKNHHQF